MATVQIEVWHLVTLLVTCLGAFAAGGKLFLSQLQRHLDDRFEAQDVARTENHQALSKRLDGIESANREEAGQWQRVERELLTLKAEMPLHYVRREDYIRGQSVIEAKLDGLATKIENAQLRAIANGAKPHDSSN